MTSRRPTSLVSNVSGADCEELAKAGWNVAAVFVDDDRSTLGKVDAQHTK